MQAYKVRPLALDTWAHVAVVYDMPGNRIRFHQNGAEVGDGSDPANGCFIDGDFTTQPVSVGKAFKGQLSDLRIWGTVRTAAQIAQLYRRRLTGPLDGLLGSWPHRGGLGARRR